MAHAAQVLDLNNKKHYLNQIQLWVTLGYIDLDDLRALTGDLYAQEQQQDAMTDKELF